ncbi:cwf18 pre-mRNA splicing factor-domain-containing protein [Mycena floridula]|nr:cwf18 pre-mRNA splicing factor-domain-containing protein [Mycena floridula]
MSLAEASEVRKARLLALKKRKDGEDDGVIKNRNFDPESRTLRKHTRDDDVEMVDTVEKDVAGMAEAIVAEDEEARQKELNVFNIAPKRPNWDLKRETNKKLAKLDSKTREAIHTLIRQRLAAQKSEASEDLLGAMNADEAQRAKETLSDEEDD